MWNALLAVLLDTLFPPYCLARGCGATGAWLCPSCLTAVSPVPIPRCSRCGAPVQYAGECRRCRRSPPPYRRAVAVGLYAGVLRDAIHALKYGRLRAVAPRLGSLAASVYGEAPMDAVVVPVPAHRSRTGERGIDQAGLLAAAVARELRRPLVTGALVRLRHTAPQVGLSPSERRANVDGAFGPAKGLGDHCVVLVDDVLTTGATANACASVLLEAGAQMIDLCTVARAGTVPAGTGDPCRL